MPIKEAWQSVAGFELPVFKDFMPIKEAWNWVAGFELPVASFDVFMPIKEA